MKSSSVSDSEKEWYTEISNILQMVHDNAISKNHLPKLGYSERAIDKILSLLSQAEQRGYERAKRESHPIHGSHG